MCSLFPDPVENGQISRDGGIEPLWGPSGRELFFRNEDGNKMMSVDILSETSFAASSPKLLFEGIYERSGEGARAFYSITPNEERFLMIQQLPTELGGRINVVLNWFEELKRLAPPD